MDAYGQAVGRIAERSGRGLMRKYVPLGGLVPEQLIVEFHGQQVAEIKQQFKVIGDIWEVDCSRIPPNVRQEDIPGVHAHHGHDRAGQEVSAVRSSRQRSRETSL